MTNKDEETVCVPFRIGVILSEISGKGELLQLNARLFHDLDIYGDDAHELLARLRDEFHLSTENFVFHKYFPPEFDGRWSRLLVWRKPTRFQKELFSPLTVKQLIDACLRGSLN